MSEENDIQEKDEYELFLESHRKKTHEELEIEKHFPNLPSWVLQQYTAKEFMWLSDQEKRNLIQFGNPRTQMLDMWSQIGG